MIHHRLSLVVVTVALVFSAALTVSCNDEEATPEEASTQVVESAATPTTAPELATPTQAPPPAAAVAEVSTPTEAPAPTEAPEPTSVPTQAAPAADGAVNIDAIFPPGRGKELSLLGCTGCHSFVPLVIVGFNEEEWDRNALDHRERCSAMTDEDYELLYDYLAEHFGPDDPVPELPEELLEQWTSY